jgi:hypothetical protein
MNRAAGADNCALRRSAPTPLTNSGAGCEVGPRRRRGRRGRGNALAETRQDKD